MTTPDDVTLPVSQNSKAATKVDDATLAADTKQGGSTFNDDYSVTVEARGIIGQELSERGKATRYRIGNEIARGGMGIVYRATDTVLEREVAIKVLQEQFPLTSAMGQRFVDEARITGMLQHPGIPPVHDLGTLPDGRPYLAMKLVMGKTFDVILASRLNPQSDQGRFIAAFEQICNAVAFAHNHRIIHRDLKPGNIMVGEFGEVQVMDWGLAKVLQGNRTSHAEFDAGASLSEIQNADTWVAPVVTEDGRTQAGIVLGTPAYMAPEQARGTIDQIDERSDVFGLGGILCVILTGKPTYTAGKGESTWQQAAAAKTSDALERLTQCQADEELIELCRKCLSANREDRPANAGEVALAIKAFREASEERAHQAQIDRLRAETTAQEQSKLRRVQLILAGTIGVLVTGAMGAGWLQQQQAAKIANAELQQKLDDELQKAQEREAEIRRSVAIGAFLDRANAILREDRAGAAANAVLALDSADKQAAEGGPGIHAERIASLRKDTELLRELDTVNEYRWTSVGAKFPDSKMVAQRFQSVLVRFGLDPQKQNAEEVAKKVTESAVRDRIILALDRMRPSAGALAVLKLVDANPFRDSMRTALWNADVAKVTELMTTPEAIEQPPAFVAVLGDQATLPADRRRELLLAAVRKRPDNMGLLFALGVLSSNVDEMIRWFQASVAVSPRVAATHHNLGNALRDKGDLPGAIASFREAATIDPSDANVQNNLGHALHVSGNIDEAVKCYRESIRLDPNLPHPHANLGSALGMMGKSQEAIAEFQEAVRLDPSMPQPRHNLGNALKGINDLDGAVASFRKAIELEPNYAQAHCNLGRVLMQQGKLEEALVHLKRGHELGSARPNWRYPSADWIAECEKLIEASKKQ